MKRGDPTGSLLIAVVLISADSVFPHGFRIVHLLSSADHVSRVKLSLEGRLQVDVQNNVFSGRVTSRGKDSMIILIVHSRDCGKSQSSEVRLNFKEHFCVSALRIGV